MYNIMDHTDIHYYGQNKIKGDKVIMIFFERRQVNKRQEEKKVEHTHIRPWIDQKIRPN